MSSTYDRSYGATYDPTMSVKEIAATTRTKLRAATKDAESPLYGWTARVRYRTASMCQSIDVYLIAPDGVEVAHQWDGSVEVNGQLVDSTRCTVCDVQAIVARSERHRSWWLTEAGHNAKSFAESIMDGYNHDGSDLMTDYFDVRFYGGVSVYSSTDTVWGI